MRPGAVEDENEQEDRTTRSALFLAPPGVPGLVTSDMTVPPGVTLPDIPIGPLQMDGRLPVFILGPCVMESEEFVWKIARALKELADADEVPFVFSWAPCGPTGTTVGYIL